jgi:hypothetical protein
MDCGVWGFDNMVSCRWLPYFWKKLLPLEEGGSSASALFTQVKVPPISLTTAL